MLERGPQGVRAEDARAASRALWLFDTDARRLAWSWAVAVALAAIVGAVLAVGIGLEPLAVRGSGLDPETQRGASTMHGLVMVLLVALPAVGGILGNGLLPSKLGLASTAWPLVALRGYQVFLAACVCFLVAFFAKPLDTGWTFGLPFALSSRSSVAWGALGAVFAVAACALCSANVVATVVASRRPLRELPFFAWTLAASSLLQVLIAPVLVAVLAAFFAQRSGASDVFEGRGLDVRFERWFLLWAEPALAAAALATAAVLGDVFAAHGARSRRSSGAAFVGVVVFTVAVVARAGLRAFGSDAAAETDVVATVLALTCGAPLVVFVIDWLASVASGAGRPTLALGYAIIATTSLVVGAAAFGLLVVPSTGAYLRDTSFAGGALHLVFVGGGLGALLAGLHLAWPLWFGAAPRDAYARLACVAFGVGVPFAFVPACFAGHAGAAHGTAGLDAFWNAATVVGLITVVAAAGLAGWRLAVTAFDAREELVS